VELTGPALPVAFDEDFEEPVTHYDIRFHDAPLRGLRVVARGSTLDALFEFADMNEAPDVKTPEGLATVRIMYQQFAKHLVSWNLTRGGVPVPATEEGLNSCEHSNVTRIVAAWLDAVQGLNRPNEEASSGASLPDVSLPMELLPGG
jgi:hypothetical protein